MDNEKTVLPEEETKAEEVKEEVVETKEAVEEAAPVETETETAEPAEQAKPQAPAEEKPQKTFNKQNNANRKRKKVCQFCADKENVIDYKNADKLRKLTSERGKILPRRVTGTCAMHQRRLTTAIKRARVLALLPYTTD